MQSIKSETNRWRYVKQLQINLDELIDIKLPTSNGHVKTN